MLTDVAVIIQGPNHGFAGAGAFVIGFIVLIVVIFAIAYGRGNRNRRPASHSAKRNSHNAGHAPQHGVNDGRKSASKHRQSRH